MKVILLQDVAKLGHRFDIVDVPAGHALNKLIPQGLAQEATSQNVKNVQVRAEKAAAERAATGAAFTDALEKVKDQTIKVAADANEQGHLFEALKSEKIAAALKEAGFNFSAKQIHIKTPIKEVGEHTLELEEGGEKGALTITVVSNR